MDTFWLPPRVHTTTGKIRRVGVEIEFHGLSLPDAAAAAAEAFGGEPNQNQHYCYTLTGSPYGDVEISFDSSLLKDQKASQILASLGLPSGETARSILESVYAAIVSPVVPREVVTPPIPVTELDVLHRLESALIRRGAVGTRSGTLYAFALQFNPEAADLTNPGYLTEHLRAFLLLYHWLFRRGRIDLMRRLLPYVVPFPENYVRLVVNPAYAPDMDTFIDDYLWHNPTRNRPLDLLPMFATINAAKLAGTQHLDRTLVKARPAFHYRLPNCELGTPGWSIAQEWNRWVVVERLAADPDMMREIGEAYLSWPESIEGYLHDDWLRTLEARWVQRLEMSESPRVE